MLNSEKKVDSDVYPIPSISTKRTTTSPLKQFKQQCSKQFTFTIENDLTISCHRW